MNYLLNVSIIEIIILATFSFAFLIQLFYYLFFYIRIATFKEIPLQEKEKFPISVIVCAKNEAENLEKNLPAILNQDYPDFELIVVNDGSTDETENVLKILKSQYNKLYVTTIPDSGKFKNGKKLAVTIGLKAAKNEWVVLTDADCKPASPDWLSHIQGKFDDSADFILAYGGYNKQKGFLNRIIRFDTLFIALQYFTFAMARLPYMGVGRNIAYRKSVFFNNKGFSKHLHLVSGDDDLFVNENANCKNTRLVLNKDSFTRSDAEKTFKDWFYQKKRHLTTAHLYRFKHKLVLGLELFSRILFYAGFIAGLFTPAILLLFFSLFFVRLIIQLSIYRSASIKFNEKGIFYLGIIFDFIIPIINFIVHLSNIKLRKRKK